MKTLTIIKLNKGERILVSLDESDVETIKKFSKELLKIWNKGGTIMIPEGVDIVKIK